MREIKFRCWWDSVKKMKYFTPGHFEDTPYGYAMTFIQPAGETNIYLGEAKIMQYTGLKDKNGIEVYEGDQIGHPLNVVKYLNGCFCINGDAPLSIFCKSNEVIGNIYETPHLLNSEQNDERSVASKDDSSTKAGKQND